MYRLELVEPVLDSLGYLKLFNQWVAGSIPARLTTEINDLGEVNLNPRLILGSEFAFLTDTGHEARPER